MKRVFSGVQPTGNLHLGNYLGAIKNWVAIQNDYDCIYCIVDLHAVTVAQDPKELRSNTREVTAGLLAAGVEPKNCIIFNQSRVREHANLAWLFNCITPLGWLNRMTQFKEKAGKKKDNAVLGLYAYPVLMAADILLYKATHVPVGEDQKQHLELARDIAGAFNNNFGMEYFPLPEPIILEEAARVMSLRDGKNKMSKSDSSDMSRINLTDDADTIRKKIRKARTDSVSGMSFDLVNRPESTNLLEIYSALSNESKNSVAERYSHIQFSEFKDELADLIVDKISPISMEIKRLSADSSYIDSVLDDGANKATAIAEEVLSGAQELFGFLAPQE
ncbi:MAG: tryptophan--tRNA ligase [Alphaproteobacteria bacterium]|nr:tryptophan--tRNA ligase [Alphaproteobacteria bacterium]|tara:strand:- start:10946 stop:11944 length:999 start_codon:yes stop_codon:yes gene_type:complete